MKLTEVSRRKITRQELTRIYTAWANEEVESIYLIEAVGQYLGLDRPKFEAGRTALSQEGGR